MNPLVVVTIIVRFIGLVLVLWTVGGVVAIVLRIVFLAATGHGADAVGAFAPRDAERTAVFALGLYLFLSGRWVIGRLTRGLAWPGGGTCHKCGYDLTGVDSSRCPECGTKLPAKSPEQAKRSS
jgi:hypothetical protein